MKKKKFPHCGINEGLLLNFSCITLLLPPLARSATYLLFDKIPSLYASTKRLWSLEDEVDDFSKWQRHGAKPQRLRWKHGSIAAGATLTTRRRKPKHGPNPPHPQPQAPAEPRALMWTTTLLQV